MHQVSSPFFMSALAIIACFLVLLKQKSNYRSWFRLAIVR